MQCDAYRNNEAAGHELVLALHADAQDRARALAALLVSLPPEGVTSARVRALRDGLTALTHLDAVPPWDHVARLEAAVNAADATLARRRTIEAWAKRVRNLRVEASLAAASLQRDAVRHRSALGHTLAANATGPLALFLLLSLVPAGHLREAAVVTATFVAVGVYLTLVALDPRRVETRRAARAARGALWDTEALLVREVARRDVV